MISSFQSDGELISGDSNTVSPSPFCERVKFEKSNSPVKWLNRLWLEREASSPPTIAAAAKRSEMFSCLNNTINCYPDPEKSPATHCRSKNEKGLSGYCGDADNFLTASSMALPSAGIRCV